MATTVHRFLLIMLLVALGSGCTANPTTTSPAAMRSGLVIDVADGDSLIVQFEEREERVRLIGINAPESGECYGPESTSELTNLLEGRTIELETDVEPRDRYGRLLGYVWLNDTLVNAEMALRGMALARSYPPNTSYQDEINAAAREARAGERGLWAPTGCVSPYESAVAVSDLQADPAGPDEDDLNGEFVVLTNLTDAVADLSHWVLRDSSSVHRYEFAAGTVLDPGADLVVHTGCGRDGGRSRFWCAAGPVWDNAGDTALLLDSAGRTVDRYEY